MPNAFARQLALLLSLVAAVLLVQHGSKDWSQPLRYVGDGLSYALMVKQVLDAGWFPGPNELLGAPFGANSLDYPVSEGANYLLLHVLGLFGDWVFAFNGFVLASYFAVAAAAFWTLSRLGFASPWPLAGALLFAFQPYHAMRLDHLFLASYHAVPLGVWLAWTVWRADEEGGWRGSPRATAVTGIIAGASGIYYAFFTCYLVAVAMLAALATARRGQALRRGILVLAIVGGTVLANVLPSIVYKAINGPNPEVAVRPYSDTERYALKPIQLLLPHAEHRIPALREITRAYAVKSPEVNENVSSSLGVIASLGFVYLLWTALRALRGVRPGSAVAEAMAALNVAVLLLAGIGGLGAVFSWLVSAQIRAYNRISVVIAFLAITGLLVLAARTFGSSGARRAMPLTAAAIIVSIALFDQTSPRDLEQMTGAYASDRAFVRTLEARLPRGARIYQMPHQRYPEAGKQVEMENYVPALGYLNSRELRWSYGNVKGRAGDRWMLALRQLPVARQVEVAERSGFSAIVVDRRGFADHGRAVEGELRARRGEPIVVSADKQLTAFALAPTGSSPAPYEDLLQPFERVDFSVTELPASITRLTGMSDREPWGRWTEGPVMRIELARPLPRQFILEIRSLMAFHPNADTPIGIRIGNVTQSFKVGTRETVVQLPFDLDGDASSIEIRIPRPTSPHELGFSADMRKIGIGLQSLAVRSAGR